MELQHRKHTDITDEKRNVPLQKTFLKVSTSSTSLVPCIHTANVYISFTPQLSIHGHTCNNHDTIRQHVECCISECPQLYNLLVSYLNTQTAGNTRNCKLKKIRHRSIKCNLQVFTIFPKSQAKWIVYEWIPVIVNTLKKLHLTWGLSLPEQFYVKIIDWLICVGL
jgi:hypothetical protein